MDQMINPKSTSRVRNSTAATGNAIEPVTSFFTRHQHWWHKTWHETPDVIMQLAAYHCDPVLARLVLVARRGSAVQFA